jgi:uncharacterized protein (DUF1697 family)
MVRNVRMATRAEGCDGQEPAEENAAMVDGDRTEGSSRTTWVALLRGINLGRHKRVAMADLRALLAVSGYGDVRTHLQSGNAIFTLPGGEGRSGRTGGDPSDVDEVAARLEREISARIAADLGLDVTVLVRSAEQLAAVFAANPFVARGIEPRELHAAFLATAPAAEVAARVDPDAYRPDELAFGDRVVYLRRPNGIQGNKLPDLAKLLGVQVTERNWNTVTRLHQLST